MQRILTAVLCIRSRPCSLRTNEDWPHLLTCRVRQEQMSHEEAILIKGKAKPQQGQLMPAAHYVFILCKGLQSSACCSVTMTTENDLLQPVCPMSMSVTEILALIYHLATLAHTPLQHFEALHLWISLTVSSCANQETQHKWDLAQSVQFGFSPWKTFQPILHDFKVVLTALKIWCSTVPEAWGESICVIWPTFIPFYPRYTASHSAFICFHLTIIWTVNMSPHGGRGLCE